MEFYADKDDDLARIVQSRMAETGASDCAVYLERLFDEAGEEMDALVAELTIGETYFFRHKEQFDALREQVLPAVIERNLSTRRLRIWSAGCATGPEPYSLAILLKREFGEQLLGWNVSIIATDINQKFLARAREGRYDEWAFRSVPEVIRRECFTVSGRQWVIRPEYRSWVNFQYHNLIKSRFPSILDNIASFDIIICRNVIIYFSRATIEGLIPCFHEALVDGGWLVMGHAEPNSELFKAFQTVSCTGTVLYRRMDAPPPPVPQPASVPVLPPPPKPAVLAPPRPRPLPTPARPAAAEPSGDVLAEARVLADRGDWEAAAKACDALLAGHNLDSRVHFFRGLVLEQLGDQGEAEASLRRAIYLDRHNVLPHYHLGLFLWRRDDAVGAGRSFRNVQTLLERLPDAHSFADGDGITVAQLREAADMHLKLIGTP
ncbi:MAG: protein-glutamate O-methyltransferase CheR [Magnetospirillum sp.]|nr:protein-glutamate O-methyltransferase CheR [Magnetospirillum sp.]